MARLLVSFGGGAFSIISSAMNIPCRVRVRVRARVRVRVRFSCYG